MNTAIDITQFSAVSALLLGLSVGLTTCTAVCLPYLGTWALGQGSGGRAAFFDTLAFATGKIAAYGVLGLLAGALGETLLTLIADGLGHWLIGLSAVVAGIWLMLPRNGPRRCGIARQQRLSPLSMGFALSFTPCAPLGALLAAAASSGEMWSGMLYGLLFGLGAAFTPLFLVIPLLGRLGHAMRGQHPWLARWLLRGAGMVLITLGAYRLLLAA